ncbi:hypothetical protein VOLCADRAFT_106854 [Volvox carteri f. nagariensis]|uniref:Methyltransferase type 11 domain-containing protein n=1 Tax=Volvox carteri f. nagariensis TaxID=3068 RepID=D8UA65_VOLCA|nr:uncharacterized protein VOLCADRAFT_106854 [Volvox carteri f. nagariensis]EFJ43419.1 hypothetical protein VOLCADRAFT_106854 [Volvox carteri f. nagariensis]|eukprot:XP_002955566.1 hypothetical protein VOLCADRAFT_106854 [Volvox carteri f. nagariensis]
MSASWMERPAWRHKRTANSCPNGQLYFHGKICTKGCIATKVHVTKREICLRSKANDRSAPFLELPWKLVLDRNIIKAVSTRSCTFALALTCLLAGDATIANADDAVATSGAALELQQAYDKYSSKYDELDGGAAAEAFGFPQLRKKLLGQARGEVLEVAVGTGLNLPYYRWAGDTTVPAEQQLAEGNAAEGDNGSSSSSSSGIGGVTSLTTVDLSKGMLVQARRRVDETPALADRPISFLQADVAALPLPDSSFDSVVDTFSLCVFPDPEAALKEAARVVRPASEGGRVLLLEHCRSDNTLLAAYQDVTAGPVAALGKGCVWNQEVEAMAVRAGLQVVVLERAAAGTVELLVAVKQP